MGPGLGKLVSCSTSIKIYEIIKLICQNPFIEQMFIENLLYATSSFVEQKIEYSDRKRRARKIREAS